jgi:hypothetical protein
MAREVAAIEHSSEGVIVRIVHRNAFANGTDATEVRTITRRELMELPQPVSEEALLELIADLPLPDIRGREVPDARAPGGSIDLNEAWAKWRLWDALHAELELRHGNKPQWNATIQQVRVRADGWWSKVELALAEEIPGGGA